MLVACCDQNFGTSTSRCSKTTSPFSFAMTADRSSHSTSSNGSTPSFVKYRSNSRPVTSLDGPNVRAAACSADPTCCVPCIPAPSDLCRPVFRWRRPHPVIRHFCRRRNEPAGQRLRAIAGKDRRGSFAVPADEYALGVAGCQERSYDILWLAVPLDATGRVWFVFGPSVRRFFHLPYFLPLSLSARCARSFGGQACPSVHFAPRGTPRTFPTAPGGLASVRGAFLHLQRQRPRNRRLRLATDQIRRARARPARQPPAR